MQPTPYVLPAAANYQVLAGNHVPPVVDATGNTFWALNVKKGAPLLYFAVFLQPTTGEAREVLAFSRVGEGKEVGQGGLSVQGDALYATAFRSPTDAVSPPFVGKVEDYRPPPVVDAATILATIIVRLNDPKSKVTEAVAAVAEKAVEELRTALRKVLG